MVIGRAILDERLLDLPLNALFWDLILEFPVHLEDLRKVDQQLAQTMLAFQEIVNKKKEIENDKNLSVALKKELIERLSFNVYLKINEKKLKIFYIKGASLDTLGINFTFPGFESILLVQNGNEKVVSIENVNEYTEAFAMKFFRDSIRLQVESFREGFNKVS